MCELWGCSRPVKARGYCEAHYQCWRRTGDPEYGRLSTYMPAEDKFWAMITTGIDPDDCWDWIGSKSSSGYGYLSHPELGRIPVIASRMSYMIHFDDPGELFVLHRCDNPPCVNPRHLFLGTQKDNIRDMMIKGRHRPWQAQKSSCKNGHEFTEENTYIRPNGNRSCRECVRAAKRRFRSKTASVT